MHALQLWHFSRYFFFLFRILFPRLKGVVRKKIIIIIIKKLAIDGKWHLCWWIYFFLHFVKLSNYGRIWFAFMIALSVHMISFAIAIHRDVRTSVRKSLKCLKRCAFQCIQTALKVWKWGFVKSKKSEILLKSELSHPHIHIAKQW